MATVVTIEPGYSPRNTQILEICSHCNRPLCPHCWNHANILDEKTGLWLCSNHDCNLEFHHFILEDQ
jgi:hypothetical protein